MELIVCQLHSFGIFEISPAIAVSSENKKKLFSSFSLIFFYFYFLGLRFLLLFGFMLDELGKLALGRTGGRGNFTLIINVGG